MFPVHDGSDAIDLVVLGAPNADSAMRYLLDTRKGYVVLLDLESANPQLEVVNESLEKFIEFLYRVERFRGFSRSAGGDDVAIADYKELLSTYLMSSDSFAMKRDTNWWSMVFDRAL